MTDLPYIDEHAAPVSKSAEQTWDAVVRTLRAEFSGGAAFARVLGAAPIRASGDWSGAGDVTGATLPGFAVVDAQRPSRLELRGQHRFSRYALVLLIDDTQVRAQTYAEFPGVSGRVYKALVIGSRAHRMIVRRMLRKIARA
ncbi:MAG: hypothetical protein M4D80_34225 [Myxococcota bacterium]|nr:hypothetical protein [Myxococcota bacterium]